MMPWIQLAVHHQDTMKDVSEPNLARLVPGSVPAV
jgi:hypothetical protein